MKNKAKICLGIVACSTVMMSSFFNKKSQTSKAAMLVEKNVKGEVFKTELKNKYLKKTVESHTLEKFEVLKGKALRTNEEQKEMMKFFEQRNLSKSFLKYQTLAKDFDHVEKRLEIVNMLILGLHYADDKESLFDITKKIILIPVSGKTEEERRMEIGDKLDLIFELNKVNPLLVKELKDITQGTHLEKIINYAIKGETKNV